MTSTSSTSRASARARRTRSRTVWRIFVPVAAALCGLLFATSFQTAGGTELRATGTDLPGLIRSENAAVVGQESQAKALQDEIDALTAQAAPGDSKVAALRKQADALAAAAGTQAVQGPVVSVTLDDAHRSADSLPAPYGPDDIVVHQQDVQGVVNALWRGGAEAMMIQDQRVISTSAVRCVGNTLILQGRVYSPPYTISAIGDVKALQGALDADPQVRIYREWVDAVGLGYDVQTKDSEQFPAYTGRVGLDLVTVSSGSGR